MHARVGNVSEHLPAVHACPQSLEAVLAGFGLMPASRYGSGPASLPEAYPKVEALFKVLWADHGDLVSTQYAGERQR